MGCVSVGKEDWAVTGLCPWEADVPRLHCAGLVG